MDEKGQGAAPIQTLNRDGGQGVAPVQTLRHDEGQGAAPVQTLSHDENLALTGYLTDGRKRIDIVLVFENDGSDVIKEMRMNFLRNIIQFGLEAEVEPGKMPEHRHLIFVKVHAPDAIIEECGLYFNEKSFFKDSHLEFVNPIVNIFGVSNERELIKVVRKQYVGPDNYSTLERSNIVYKILLQMPFGKYKNHFGINKLIQNNIISDAFALHDGPYFIVPKQDKAHMNARQVLFIEWLGVINVWKTQPIHMIHEYFGKRVSYYFAFYEYFNFMLIISSIFGVLTLFLIMEDEGELEPYPRLQNHCLNEKKYMFPECRNFTLCPVLKTEAYCDELKLLSIIDKKLTFGFGFFMAVWGIFFLIPWRYIERYLTWIWEDTRKYTNKLMRIDYEEHEMKTEEETKINSIKKAKNPGRQLKMFIYILTAASFILWSLLMFRFSILIWHYPRWKRFVKQKDYLFKFQESENLAVAAGLYTCIVCVIKMVIMVLAQKVTDYENNETFLIHDRSIALKMYAFSFIGSFMILITYTYLGTVFLRKRESLTLYNHMFGFGMMNSGLGSTLDDISITLCVMTILEHVIFRIAGFLIKDKTDYPAGFQRRAPCWEREYKLKPLTEFFFHKRYNALVMQFALLTCYSMMFPVASFFLLIINIWDLRHAAGQLLLEYRRPLLINTSGPGFWKYLILITALYAPMSNTGIIIYQSWLFSFEYFIKIGITFMEIFDYSVREAHKPNETGYDYGEMIEIIKILYPDDGDPHNWICSVRHFRSKMFQEMQLELETRYLILMTLLTIVIGLLLLYVIPGTSNSLEDTIKYERRIKNKYQIRRALLSN